MKGSLNSPEYLRYLMFQKIYHDAKEIAAEVTRRAGGPIRSACDIGIIRRIPELYGFVEAGIARFTDRLQAITDSFEPDGATTTLKGAIRDCFTAIRYPGLALHNNVTEQTIRDKVIPPRRRSSFPNWKAADNFSILRTFSATCKKNGASVRDTILAMANDPSWGLFTLGIPPPILRPGDAQAPDPMLSAMPA